MTVHLDDTTKQDPRAADHSAELFETITAAKRMWEQTFDALNCGIVVRSETDRIVRCNRFAASMLDRAPAQIVGLTWSEIFVRLFGERSSGHLQDTKEAASSFELLAEDGSRYLISVSPLDLPGGEPGSVITWNNVTELAEVQEQLSRSRRLATVGRLAAGVAHEINTPLASITVCAEAALRDLRKTDGTVSNRDQWTFYLEEIVRQAMRCKSITRGLLDLSSQRVPASTTCDINEVVADSLQMARQRAGRDAISFSAKLDPLAGELATDALMVRQIIDNLLTNAIDAIPESGEIKLTTERDGQRISVEVADTGKGIDPEQLARVFDPFFTTKDPGKGSGLGLAVSSAFADSLDGAITVESTPEEGSKFKLWLPRRAPEKLKSS